MTPLKMNKSTEAFSLPAICPRGASLPSTPLRRSLELDRAHYFEPNQAAATLVRGKALVGTQLAPVFCISRTPTPGPEARSDGPRTRSELVRMPGLIERVPSGFNTPSSRSGQKVGNGGLEAETPDSVDTRPSGMSLGGRDTRETSLTAPSISDAESLALVEGAIKVVQRLGRGIEADCSSGQMEGEFSGSCTPPTRRVGPLQRYSTIIPTSCRHHPEGPLNIAEDGTIKLCTADFRAQAAEEAPEGPLPFKERFRNGLDALRRKCKTATEQEIMEDRRWRAQKKKNAEVKRAQKQAAKESARNSGARINGGDIGTGGEVKPIKAYLDMLEKEEKRRT